MFRPAYLAGLAAACALVSAFPSSASAACTSSTKNSQSFADAHGDDDGGLAPDIGAVLMITTESCGTAGSISLTDGRDSMIDGESVGMYYDVDGNSATGSPTFKGADRVIITIGQNGADSNPGVGVFNSATGKFEFGSEADPIDVGVGGWGWGIDQIAFQPTTVGVYTITMYEGSTDSYADFSPEPGSAPHGYSVAYSTGQAPSQPTEPTQPAQPAQPTAPAEPQPTQQPATQPFTCKPGSLRGLKLGIAKSKATARGCDVKVKFKKASRKKRGRVISTTVRGSTVTLFVGRRSARASASRVRAGGAPSVALTPEGLNDRFLSIAAGRQR